MPQVFRRPFRLISGGAMRSFPRQLSDQTSTHIALMNSVRFRMASGPKPYRYLRAYVVVLVVIELLTRRIVVIRVEVGRVVATATKRREGL